jgi:hypothetical protein
MRNTILLLSVIMINIVLPNTLIFTMIDLYNYYSNLNVYDYLLYRLKELCIK